MNAWNKRNEDSWFYKTASGNITYLQRIEEDLYWYISPLFFEPYIKLECNNQESAFLAAEYLMFQ